MGFLLLWCHLQMRETATGKWCGDPASGPRAAEARSRRERGQGRCYQQMKKQNGTPPEIRGLEATSFAQFECQATLLKVTSGRCLHWASCQPCHSQTLTCGNSRNGVQKDPWPCCGLQDWRKLLSFYPSQPMPGGRRPV